MSNQSNEAKFFDFHATGIGYLNRIREVKPRGKGKPFWAVTVAALRGSTDNAEYTYIDCNAVGADAETLIKRCQPAVEAGKKVLVSFRIGDMWADAFTYEKGEKKGQAGASLKARLLFIGWIKVDGKLVYEAKPKTTDTTADDLGHPAAKLPVEQELPVAEQFANEQLPDFGPESQKPANEAA
ncbi:STY4534 family ICE replication protein [Pseudomonas sp. SC11]|uniref:STY4534 family ICE replication protein n=1 Tax=Pseudomonas sp. SC11 TaxID=326927 RepID=UPI00399AA698